MIRRDRSDSWGGVLIALKKDLVYVHLAEFETKCEILWVQIQLAGSNMHCMSSESRLLNLGSPTLQSTESR